MAFYAGMNIWRDVVYQLETHDPVIGGTVNWRGDEPSSGYSNAPLIQLADRTTFLKEEVGKILTEIEDGVLSAVDSDSTESIEIIGDGSADNPLRANIRSSFDSIAWTRGNNTYTRNNLFRGLTEVEDPTTPRSAINKRSLENKLKQNGERGSIIWHSKEIKENVAIPSGYNAMSVGPEVVINEGVTVTVGEDSHWTVV